MKTRHIIMALVIAMVCFFSCSKDDYIWEHTNIKLLQKTTMCYGDTMSSEIYSYDEKGRLVHILCWDSTYTIYKYEDNKVDMIHYSRLRKPYTHSVYTLNSKGLAVSSIDTGFSYMSKSGNSGSFTSGGFNQTWTETYEYDDDGFLIKMIQTMSWGISYTMTYSVTGGNITQKLSQVSTGLSTYDYQFIPGSLNTIDLENQGIFFKGRQNANLILVETFNYNSGGITTRTGNYTYEYDEKNRVTKMTMRQSRILEFVTTCTYVD